MLKLIKAINMQKESGVTLTGIIVYVIAMAIVISIVATITSFFYTNIMGDSGNELKRDGYLMPLSTRGKYA